MKTKFSLLIATGLVVTGCQTTMLEDNCVKAKSFANAVQVLADAGELSEKNVATFEDAKVTLRVVCSSPNPSEDQLVAAAQLYVVLAKIWRNR